MPVLPRPKAVKDMLAGLLDREIQMTPVNPPRAADLLRTAAAVYVDAGTKLVAVAGLDLPLAATVGALVAMVPYGQANACVEKRQLSPRIAENLTDACESFGVLFTRDGEPPVRLYQVVLPGERMPGDVTTKLLSPGRRLDLDVAAPGYPAGRLSVSV